MTPDEFLLAHRFYSYRDVLDLLYAGDEDAFLDAWCDGTLPWAIRHACEDSMPPRTMELALLRRIVRLLAETRRTPG